MTRPFLISAALLAALGLSGCNSSAEDTAAPVKKPSGEQTDSSTATITQSGADGTTTTTRSTDGSQTIKRESGGNSATVTQSP